MLRLHIFAAIAAALLWAGPSQADDASDYPLICPDNGADASCVPGQPRVSLFTALDPWNYMPQPTLGESTRTRGTRWDRDMENAGSFRDGGRQRNIEAVGRMSMRFRDTATGLEFADWCTAWLVDTDVVLTNRHCIRRTIELPNGAQHEAEAIEAFVLFRFYANPRPNNQPVGNEPMSVDSAPGVWRSNVVLPPIDLPPPRTLDYAVLRIQRPPNVAPIVLDPRAPDPDEHFYIIHHPQGSWMRITRVECDARPDPVAGPILFHKCATEGGSSGSPIFGERDNRIIALHFCGMLCRGDEAYNKAYLLSAVIAQSPALQEIAARARATQQPEQRALIHSSVLRPQDLELRLVQSRYFQEVVAPGATPTDPPTVLARILTRDDAWAMEDSTLTPGQNSAVVRLLGRDGGGILLVAFLDLNGDGAVDAFSRTFWRPNDGAEEVRLDPTGSPGCDEYLVVFGSQRDRQARFRACPSEVTWTTDWRQGQPEPARVPLGNTAGAATDMRHYNGAVVEF